MDVTITALIVRATARAGVPSGLRLPWEPPWWPVVTDGHQIPARAAAAAAGYWLTVSGR
jgi:hypothetical protein